MNPKFIKTILCAILPLVALPSTGALVATVLTTSALTMSASSAEAGTIRSRIRENRRERVVRSQIRRTGRTVRRVIRRNHIFGLPRGYRTVTYGRYRYYMHANRYYYPYFVEGRKVYVQINVGSNGRPLAPPSASEIYR